MAFNQFIGNKDYRGYLNYLSKNQANSNTGLGAGTLLKYSNNQAQLNNAFGEHFGQGAGTDLVALNRKLYSQYGKLNPASSGGNIGSIYGGGGGPAPPVYAPKLDILGIQAQARKAATAATNPYYHTEMKKFLARQAQLKGEETTQYQTNVQNYEDQLKNSLEGNEQTRTRTGEDVAQNIGDINTQADQFQTDTGQAFDTARRGEEVGVANAGLTTSGLGKQQLAQSQQQRNTEESRQEATFQEQRSQQALFKGRTLEDLLKSDELAKTTTAKGKKQAKFDLDKYLHAASYETTTFKRSQRKAQLEDIGQKARSIQSTRVAQAIERINNPAQKAAAYSTYGGYI